MRDDKTLPIRLGAIDTGSNAIRFLAAQVTRGDLRVLESVRVPIRLGHAAFQSGSIDEASIAAVVDAFQQFRSLLVRHGISRYRAVATSAVRESSNGHELIERVRAATGITLEAIDGSEEARLVYVAVRRRVNLGRDKWLLADLGGGSLEVSIIDAERVIQTESYSLGATRMVEQVAAGEMSHHVAVRAMQIDNSRVLCQPAAGLIATGGNIDALAQLVGGRAQITATQLDMLVDQLAGMTVQQRIERLGLRDDRADVILPAAIIYRHVAEVAGKDTVLVPNVGVKEGIIFDAVDGLGL